MTLKKMSVVIIASIISAVVLAVCLNRIVYYSNHKEISIVIYHEDSTYEEHKLEVGGTLLMLKDPIREGYEFEGWFKDETYTTEYSFNEPITEDTVIYAKYRKL